MDFFEIFVHNPNPKLSLNPNQNPNPNPITFFGTFWKISDEMSYCSLGVHCGFTHSVGRFGSCFTKKAILGTQKIENEILIKVK